MALRILWKTHIVFTEVAQEECFPGSTGRAVFSCQRFHSEGKQIILVPSKQCGVDDPPEPFVYAADLLQRPVFKISIQKFFALFDGLKACHNYGYLTLNIVSESSFNFWAIGSSHLQKRTCSLVSSHRQKPCGQRFST